MESEVLNITQSATYFLHYSCIPILFFYIIDYYSHTLYLTPEITDVQPMCMVTSGYREIVARNDRLHFYEKGISAYV